MYFGLTSTCSTYAVQYGVSTILECLFVGGAHTVGYNLGGTLFAKGRIRGGLHNFTERQVYTFRRDLGGFTSLESLVFSVKFSKTRWVLGVVFGGVAP